MKKIAYSLTILLVAVLLVTGCNGGSKKISCKLKSTPAGSNYSLEAEYNIYADGDTVSKVETTEIVESEDDDTLEYFEDLLKDQYDAYNEKYGGYDFKVTNKDGKVTSKVTINYSKMNLSKFVEDNTAMKSYVNDDNKLKLKGIQSLYETMGAECK